MHNYMDKITNINVKEIEDKLIAAQNKHDSIIRYANDVFAYESKIDNPDTQFINYHKQLVEDVKIELLDAQTLAVDAGIIITE